MLLVIFILIGGWVRGLATLSLIPDGRLGLDLQL